MSLERIDVAKSVDGESTRWLRRADPATGVMEEEVEIQLELVF